MRDEFSFKSLKIKADLFEEKSENNIDSKNLNSISTLTTNNKNENNLSRQEKAKSLIKEYFEKNIYLTQDNFDSFLSFIGLKDIWNSKEDQKYLWDSIKNKAKDKENIDHDSTLETIMEFFETEEEENRDEDKNDEDSNYSLNDKNELETSSLFEEENKNNEHCIDEYLNEIRNNIKLTFGIKFINEIFLKKYLKENNNNNDIINNIESIKINKIDEQNIENGKNIDINKNANDNIIEKEIDANQINKNLNRNIVININDILEEINNIYRFIMITKEELNNYFNNLAKNNTIGSRKSSTGYCITIKNGNSQEYILDKQLIKYVNTMIELNFKENEKQLNVNKEREIYSAIKEKDNFDDEQIIKNLNKFDNATSDLIDLIINTNSDKELKNILKMFNSNYILYQKKILYNKIEEKINQNKNNNISKIDETEIQLNINEINQSNNSKSKIVIVPKDENDYLKQQIDNLKERIDNLLNENEELKRKLSLSTNKIDLKNSNIKINKLNIPKNNFYIPPPINSKNYKSSRDEQRFRNKTPDNENSIFNMLNQKNHVNPPHCNTNRNPLISLNISKLNIANTSRSNPNLLNDNNKNSSRGNKTNSFMDYNGEELTNSKLDLFSVNGNKNIKEGFLLETTELINDPGTPTLTPRSNVFKDDYFCLGEEHNIRIGSKISDILSSRENYPNNDNNSSNNKKINFNKKKKMSFGLNADIFKDDSDDDNSDNLLDEKYKYDFQYLSLNKKIVKLLLHNNEDLKSYDIFSDQINYILNGQKRSKGILLITSQCFYILDDSNEMKNILRISHQLLSNLSINKHFFNHILISFNEGSFIIIEIFSRIHLLEYLKDLYERYNYKKIHINFCDSFNIKLKNNIVYTYELKNKKDILFTPNFENAKKIGILFKYQENFFSAYFQEKIVVLTSIGLIVFDKNNFNKPQMIIPIIGSGIKAITAKDKQKLYCFKIKTINNEKFIFGSYKNKEIIDWMKELRIYKELYKSKMDEIISDFTIETKK